MKTEESGHPERASAAAPTLSKLTELAQRMTAKAPRIAAMLLYIRDHLFDHDLSVAKVKKECRLRDNAIALRFHRELGQPPGTLIASSRLAVAEELLAKTWLPIWKITELLGYSSIQVFSRTYLRRKGKRPSAYRSAKIAEGVRAVSAPAAADPVAHGGNLFERALAGKLSDEEARSLVLRLLELYPPHRKIASDGGSISRVPAESATGAGGA